MHGIGGEERIRLSAFFYRIKIFACVAALGSLTPSLLLAAGVVRSSLVVESSLTFEPHNYAMDFRQKRAGLPTDTVHQASSTLSIVRHLPIDQTLWMVAVFVLALVGLIALGYYLRMRQAKRVFDAILSERARIAREIHDTLLQGCASVAALLDAAGGCGAGDNELRLHLIQYASTQIRATIDEGRQAVSSLRSETQAPCALVESLRITTERNGRAYGIETALVVEGEPFLIDEPTTRALAMIVREAFFNALLHANAGRIFTGIEFTAQELSIEVTDDGQGFSISSSHGDHHYGIIGMRERVETFGGRFMIESMPGKGTSVRIHIPRDRVQMTPAIYRDLRK